MVTRTQKLKLLGCALTIYIKLRKLNFEALFAMEVSCTITIILFLVFAEAALAN